MKENSISIIVISYKRPKELGDCLDSVLSQTVPVKETVVINNAEDDDRAREVVEERKSSFREKGINLLYLKNPGEDGLTIARNLGTKLTSARFVSQVDDDVVLDKDYHKKILKVFENYPQALAVQGYLDNLKEKPNSDKSFKAKAKGLFDRVFQISSGLKENECRVFPSLYVTYPAPSINRIINCEWLAGCAAVYKRELLEEFPFDEKLIRFSWCFDQEHGYRIFKKYPDSILLTPEAKFWHYPSQGGRLARKDLIYITEVCELYTFYKIMEPTLINKLKYIWRKTGTTIIGRILYPLITLGKGDIKTAFLKAKYGSGALIYCLINFKKIKNGDLDSFNKEIIV